MGQKRVQARTRQGKVATDQPTEPEVRPPQTPAERRHRRRVLAAAIIGALVTAFAFLNLNDVKVHWGVTTGQTPLIVVIVIAFLLGIVFDRLVLLRGRRRRK